MIYNTKKNRISLSTCVSLNLNKTQNNIKKKQVYDVMQ